MLWHVDTDMRKQTTVRLRGMSAICICSPTSNSGHQQHMYRKASSICILQQDQRNSFARAVSRTSPGAQQKALQAKGLTSRILAERSMMHTRRCCVSPRAGQPKGAAGPPSLDILDTLTSYLQQQHQRQSTRVQPLSGAQLQ
jgi:hypothetical protein